MKKKNPNQISIFDIMIDHSAEPVVPVMESPIIEIAQPIIELTEDKNICPYKIPTVDEIIKRIKSATYRVNTSQLIADVFECGAISIANTVTIPQDEPCKKWFETSWWCTANDAAYDPYAVVVNPSFVYKFPQYKYSAYNLYKGVDVLQYLRLYEKHPQIEYLVKLGLSDYVHSKQIFNECTSNKDFRKWLIRNSKDISQNKYYVSTILTAYKSKRPCAEIQKLEKIKKELSVNKDLKPIREFFKGNLEKFYSYIVEQKTTLPTYKDYFKACTELGLDMTLSKNAYPHDFKHWHDARIDEYASKKAKLDKEKRKAFYKQFAGVAQKYNSLQMDGIGDFVCLIAKSPAELIREGDYLHHCVGTMGYDQKFVREETLIFFIRANNDVKTPFVTVEYSPSNKAVLQCQTTYHARPNDNVWNFVHEQWLPYANKQLKKIAA